MATIAETMKYMNVQSVTTAMDWATSRRRDIARSVIGNQKWPLKIACLVCVALSAAKMVSLSLLSAPQDIAVTYKSWLLPRKSALQGITVPWALWETFLSITDFMTTKPSTALLESTAEGVWSTLMLMMKLLVSMEWCPRTVGKAWYVTKDQSLQMVSESAPQAISVQIGTIQVYSAHRGTTVQGAETRGRSSALKEPSICTLASRTVLNVLWVGTAQPKGSCYPFDAHLDTLATRKGSLLPIRYARSAICAQVMLALACQSTSAAAVCSKEKALSFLATGAFSTKMER